MNGFRFVNAFLFSAAVLAGPLAAQEHKIQLGVYGGGVAPLAELGQVNYPLGGGAVGYRHFKKGVSFGANALLWLDNNLGLRADGNFVTSKVVEPFVGCLPDCERGWNKIFFSGDIVLRGSPSGLSPFGYFGGGIVKMSESGYGRKATRPTARVGVGLNYTPSGALGFFGELGLMVYDFDQKQFTFYDKVQTDVGIKLGVSLGL
jgi:hypothetical protein